MEANKCPNCGASINNETDRITTCKYCGGTIINEAATVEKPEPPKTETREFKSKKELKPILKMLDEKCKNYKNDHPEVF